MEGCEKCKKTEAYLSLKLRELLARQRELDKQIKMARGPGRFAYWAEQAEVTAQTDTLIALRAEVR